MGNHFFGKRPSWAKDLFLTAGGEPYSRDVLETAASTPVIFFRFLQTERDRRTLSELLEPRRTDSDY
jgi:hypothetical protein